MAVVAQHSHVASACNGRLAILISQKAFGRIGQRIALLLITLLPFHGTFAEHTLTSGLHFSSGDYGDPVDTAMWYMPFSYRYRDEHWQLQITVPYLKLTGPGNVVGTRGDVVTVNSDDAFDKSTESGLGDTLLKVGYALLQDYQSMWFLDLSGKIKIPTADEERGLGTGQRDFTVQFDVYKVLGRHTVFTSPGYKTRGDGSINRTFHTSSGDVTTRQQLSLSDGWFTSLGYDWRARKDWQTGLIWDWRETANSKDAASQELIFYGQWRTSRQWRVMAYLGTGLSSNSADVSTGMQASYRF